MSYPDSSLSEEDKAWQPELQTTGTEPKWEESEDGAGQTDPEEEVEPDRWQCLQDWKEVIEGSEGLVYNDPWSDSMATVRGQMTRRGLHYPYVMRPSTAHPTPSGV